MLLGFYAKMNDLSFIRMDSTMMQLFQNQDSEKCWDAIRVCLWSTNKWELAVMQHTPMANALMHDLIVNQAICLKRKNIFEMLKVLNCKPIF